MSERTDPAYAALVAARNAGIKAVGKPALRAAYGARQMLAALCDCTAESTELDAHAAWCAYSQTIYRRRARGGPDVHRR